MRLITGSNYCSPTLPLFTKLNILRLQDIRKFQLAVLMFNYIHKLLPDACTRHMQVTHIDQNRRYQTRLTEYYKIEYYRTNIRGENIDICGPKVWNSLPLSLQKEKRIYVFKKNLKALFIASYSVDKY